MLDQLIKYLKSEVGGAGGGIGGIAKGLLGGMFKK